MDTVEGKLEFLRGMGFDEKQAMSAIRANPGTQNMEDIIDFALSFQALRREESSSSDLGESQLNDHDNNHEDNFNPLPPNHNGPVVQPNRSNGHAHNHAPSPNSSPSTHSAPSQGNAKSALGLLRKAPTAPSYQEPKIDLSRLGITTDKHTSEKSVDLRKSLNESQGQKKEEEVPKRTMRSTGDLNESKSRKEKKTKKRERKHSPKKDEEPLEENVERLFLDKGKQKTDEGKPETDFGETLDFDTHEATDYGFNPDELTKELDEYVVNHGEVWLDCPPPASRKKDDFADECLDATQIIDAEENAIKSVSDTLQIPPQAALPLLRLFKWDVEKVVASFVENYEKVTAEAGLLPSDLQTDSGNRNPEAPISECSVCGEDNLAQDEIIGLSCHHYFCSDCWKNYLSLKVTAGETNVHCMAKDCKVAVPQPVLKQFLAEDLFKKYSGFRIKSFVEDQKNYQWCPAKNCTNVIKSEQPIPHPVRCSCGFIFCFKCAEETHIPASCDQLKMWLKKCHDDSETYNWIGVNTKPCPKCNFPIEKNGGCNHMTCRKCNHEFCWICFGNWKTHVVCNRFKKTDGTDGKKNMKKKLDRYLHYFHRYNAHAQSKVLETKLRENSVQKMIRLKEEENWLDVEYIDQATEALITCRTTLKYSYAFAYYIKGEKERSLFEFLQAELEKATEHLSGLLENPALDSTSRRVVVTATKLARGGHNNLVAAVNQGLMSGAQRKGNLMSKFRLPSLSRSPSKPKKDKKPKKTESAPLSVGGPLYFPQEINNSTFTVMD